MSPTRPRLTVRLNDIHFTGMAYFDWLATGLWALEERGRVDAQINVTAPTHLFRQQRHLVGLGRRLAPNLMRSLERGWATIITGSVTDGSRTTTFVFDASDSPYFFDVELLARHDLYFKCQLPATLDPAGFPLADGALMPYHPDVWTYRDRIRPAMLGRPLSRRLNRRANAQVLRRWQARASAQKDTLLLAYFGADDWSDNGPEGTLLRRFDGLVEHPNRKRGRLVTALRASYPGRADARIVHTARADRRGPALTDRAFNSLVGRAWHNLNISGFRRSAPFRLIDSFLVGASVPTDTLGVRWYRPLEEGVEVHDLGAMGYERPERVDWRRAYGVLEALAAEPERRRQERRRAVLAGYHAKWAPAVFADYVVSACTSVW